MLAVNILVVLLAIGCAVLTWDIWKRIGGQGRLLVLAAFVYLVGVRIAVLLKILFYPNLPTAEATIPFYVLMFLGLFKLAREIRKVLRK